MPTSIDLGNDFVAQFETLGEAEWNDELLAFADASLYQTWAYAAVRFGDAHVTRMVLRHHGGVVALAQSRLYTFSRLPYGLAYTHWGPVWRLIGQPANLRVLQKALEALVIELTHRRKLMLRLLPPVYGCDPDAAVIRQTILDGGFSESRSPDKTHVVDMRSCLADLRKGLDKKWRNQLSAAERAGLSISDGDSESLLEPFLEIHKEMWARKGIKKDPGLTALVQSYSRLPVALRPRVVLARKDDRSIAGVILSTIGKTAIYLLGASSTEGMEAKASNLLQWHCLTLLKRLGVENYDLAGSDPDKHAGIHHFKAGLCGRNGVATSQLGLFTCSGHLVSDVVVRTGLFLRAVLTR